MPVTNVMLGPASVEPAGPALHCAGRYILASQPKIYIADEASHASCFGHSWTVLHLRRIFPRALPPRWSPWDP
eukprot:3547046-Pyramimonas_sp.AAC.1